MSCSSWHLGTSVGRSRIAHGPWPAWSTHPAHTTDEQRVRRFDVADGNAAALLPRLVQGTEGSLEFGGNLVQGWGNGR
jgi:hypothetical protein